LAQFFNPVGRMKVNGNDSASETKYHLPFCPLQQIKVINGLDIVFRLKVNER